MYSSQRDMRVLPFPRVAIQDVWSEYEDRVFASEEIPFCMLCIYVVFLLNASSYVMHGVLSFFNNIAGGAYKVTFIIFKVGKGHFGLHFGWVNPISIFIRSI